ncbi:MAG: glutamate 5-kinase [Pirellulaceae bacterium]|nr:MAG: glutamate 5-kinase [Pirellulaceae bacterium]
MSAGSPLVTDLVRQEIAASARLLVVKVGTRVLTADDGRLDHQQVARIAEQLCALRSQGRQVVLVSSGAVGAGVGQLGLARRPTDLAHLQAVAAVGQARLIEAYDRVLSRFGIVSAQVLLTADDLDHRTRYLNVRNTLRCLLEYGALPIVNENDTVAVDELMLTFGDNDALAARVTNLLCAPLLVILSDVAGLYDGDPKNPNARLVDVVWKIDRKVEQWVSDGRSQWTRGGMASKLRAAKAVTAAGENVIIAGGRQPDVLVRIMRGEPVGTLFVAQGKSVDPRRRWIGFSARPRGTIVADAGACRALVHQGRSLLPIGVVSVQGQFRKGDVVSVCDPSGKEIARGLTNYGSDEVERIRGLHSHQIAERLGHRPYEELIHRDNLLVWAADEADELGA